MRKIVKILLIILGIVIVAISGLIIYLTTYLPNINAPDDLVIELTPERIDRGRYLANEMMGCVGCHTLRDFSRFAGPIIQETIGEGGEHFSHEMNFPGDIYAPNITPGNLKNWSDGEIFRAITSGVNKDGKALFPVMPYQQYGKLPREDIYAVIAYLRTLEPSDKVWPERKLDFPLNLIVNTMPAYGTHHLAPDENDMLKHGEYVITAAVCFDCHTPMDDKGQYLKGMEFAGGSEFPLPTGGVVRSANLTPDRETGIGNWTMEAFVNRFKFYADSAYVPTPVKPGDFNTYMPWEYYSKLNERDLQSIYTYLMSLKPIRNPIVKFNQ